MNFQIGVAKNNKKLLELGKEITQGVIERFEELYYGYVNIEDISDETLISIGKKIYSETELFAVHTRNIYEEDNFHWTNKVYDSFDKIANIVSDAIVDSGEYFFEENAEMYLLATYTDEVDTTKKLSEKLVNVGKYNPLTIVLNKAKSEYIFILLAENENQYIVEQSFANGQFEKKYINLEEEEILAFVNEIELTIKKYNDLVQQFKLKCKEELNTLLDINAFDLPELLPRDIEYKILKDYIVDVIAEAIKYKDTESIGHYELEYLWKKAEEHLEVFSNEGNLNNLTQEELDLIYSLSLEYKDEETPKEISIRYLREYFTYVLIKRNIKGNNFDLIALYHLLLESINDLSHHLEQMYNNNFSFEELNNDVMNLNFENPTIKQEVAEKLEELFKEYISETRFTDKYYKLQNTLSELFIV